MSDNDSQGSVDEEVCIVMAGSVDSGKSTTIGVLTTGKLDDGNGSARTGVAVHPHEITSGKTSDISTRTFKINENKEIVIVDLCGHKKYLKTTLFGITGYFADYGVLVVAANRGFLPMTKEHMGILLHMEIPFIILITRADIAPSGIYEKTVQSIKGYLRQYQKQPRFLNSLKGLELDDMNRVELETEIEINAIKEVQTMVSNPNIVPVLTVSNKTGYCVNTFRSMLNHLKPREDTYFKETDPSVFYIDKAYNKKGIGLVASGMCKGKPIPVNSEMYLGPYGKDWIPIRVWSIHNNNKQNIEEITHKRRGCLAFKATDKQYSVEKNTIKKGMVIISKEIPFDQICYQFNALITVLNHSTTISNKYSPVIHCGVVRQTARIIMDPTLTLRTNDQATVNFRFISHPEFLRPGMEFFFREGTTRGHGTITSILSLADDPDPQPAIAVRKPKFGARYGHHKKTKKKINISATKST